jgi:excisionase family DNA binding protein
MSSMRAAVRSIPPGEASGIRILTLSEAASELRCSKAHIRNVIAGKLHDLPPLPVLRIGRRVLIRYDALMAWLMFLEGREVEERRATGSFG